MRDLAGLTVTVKTRVEKFEGDDRSKPPIEVIEREEILPLSALPPELREAVLKDQENGTDKRRT